MAVKQLTFSRKFWSLSEFILYIIEVKIVVLLKWSYQSSRIMLTIEPRTVTLFQAHLLI